MYENRQEIKDVCELIQNSGTKILKKDARINFAYKYWNITDKDLTELYEILIKSHFERKPKSITILGDFMDEQKITNYRTFGADMKYRTLENTLKTTEKVKNNGNWLSLYDIEREFNPTSTHSNPILYSYLVDGDKFTIDKDRANDILGILMENDVPTAKCIVTGSFREYANGNIDEYVKTLKKIK